MKIIAKASLLILLTGAMIGCTPNISPDTVDANNANQLTHTVEGKIVSLRTVTVKADSDNKTGMLAGGLAGGVAGSAIGGGSRMPILGAIGGALLSGIAGDAIQEKISTQQGIEYIVKIKKGGLLTIVQGAGTETYRINDCVYVVEGSHARIVSRC